MVTLCSSRTVAYIVTICKDYQRVTQKLTYGGTPAKRWSHGIPEHSTSRNDHTMFKTGSTVA